MSIEITVERLEGGEVSSFLHDDVVAGDRLEVRGPIGGWFVWRGDTPALLVGGGSGLVPLMAMLRLAGVAKGAGTSPASSSRFATRPRSIMRASLRAPRPQLCTRGGHRLHLPAGRDGSPSPIFATASCQKRRLMSAVRPVSRTTSRDFLRSLAFWPNGSGSSDSAPPARYDRHEPTVAKQPPRAPDRLTFIGVHVKVCFAREALIPSLHVVAWAGGSQ